MAFVAAGTIAFFCESLPAEKPYAGCQSREKPCCTHRKQGFVQRLSLDPIQGGKLTCRLTQFVDQVLHPRFTFLLEIG
jgi:hypothetical protein